MTKASAVAVALLFVFVCGDALADAGSRVGVVTVGPDSAIAGDLQRDLEARLAATPKITLQVASQLGSLLSKMGASAASTVDPATQKEAAALLQTASDAYYDDRAANALERLGALAALEQKAGNFPLEDRVRLRLWKAAVFLALNDVAQATAEALAALTISPELKVDEDEFRPSVAELVEKVRGRGLPMVTVLVNGLPDGALLAVDGRAAKSPFRVAAGKHAVTASAASRRDVSRVFDAKSDLSLPMALPIALDATLESQLSTLVWRGQAAASDVPVLAGLSRKLGIDWLVVGGSRTDPSPQSRVALVSLSTGVVFASPLLSSGAGANTSLVSWVDSRLQSAIAGTATGANPVGANPTPVPTAVALSTPVPLPPSAVDFSVRGGVLGSDRTRVMEDGSGAGFTARFTGAGPHVSIVAGRHALFGEIDASYVSYAGSEIDVRLLDGTERTVGGGTTVAARGGGGWRHAFGQGDWDGSPVARVGVGVGYESHAAEDVEDAAGEPIALLPSYSRAAVELRADGRLPFPRAPLRPSLVAGVGIAPISVWSEKPAKASGNSPKTGLATEVRAGLGLTPVAKLDLLFEVSFGSRSVAFSGPAKLSPELQDTTVTETFLSGGVSARFRF